LDSNSFPQIRHVFLILALRAFLLHSDEQNLFFLEDNISNDFSHNWHEVIIGFFARLIIWHLREQYLLLERRQAWVSNSLPQIKHKFLSFFILLFLLHLSEQNFCLRVSRALNSFPHNRHEYVNLFIFFIPSRSP
jgi:hypothetical protein